MTEQPARLIRSHLFAPGHSTRLLAKVFLAGADAVVLDLEDAVPAAEKGAARRAVSAALADRTSAESPLVFVRINGLETSWWEADLDAIVQPGLDGIRISKAQSAADVERVATVLDRLEPARGLAAGRLAIVPTIESAAGVLHAAEIASGPRVRALSFGATDFARDLGAQPGPDDLETLFARSALVVASRAASIDPPIASVYTHLSDDAGLRRSCEAARRLGFFGRSCIHPSQLAIVHEVFTPSAEDVARARAIVSAAADAAERGVGAFVTAEGEFVDRAVVDRARAVLARAVAGNPTGPQEPAS